MGSVTKKISPRISSHLTGGWSNPTFENIATMGNGWSGSANGTGQGWQAKGQKAPSGGTGGTDPNKNNTNGVVGQQAGTNQAVGPNGEPLAQQTGDQRQAAVQAQGPVMAPQNAVLPKYIIPRNIKEAQAQVIDRQNRIASGQRSVSDLQYKQSLDDIAKGQSSAAASARGVSNTGLLQRNVMQAGQQAGLDVARESAAAKMLEQRKADDMIAAMAAAANGVSMQRAIADQQADTAKRGQDMQMVGNLAASASTVAAGSDENIKTNIKPSEGESTKVISEFMDALKSYTYEYKKGSKQPGGKPTPEGEVKSVMAQDLEKSELGKQMVTNTPNGKVVDYAQGMAPLFAAIAELNERTKNLGKGK